MRQLRRIGRTSVAAPPGRIRIIGGRWKRRLISVPAVPGLRPTPDRVRETLFNWLAPDLPGARCLDLFAGTGALGFEAASRGASRVVLVERDPRVVRHLEQQARALGAGEVQVVPADAESWLETCSERFDVVFLDPPFGTLDIPRLLARLAQSPVLAPHALVYLETPADGDPVCWPSGWSALRAQRAGRVRYHLALTSGDPSP